MFISGLPHVSLEMSVQSPRFEFTVSQPGRYRTVQLECQIFIRSSSSGSVLGNGGCMQIPFFLVMNDPPAA